jgi:sortase A
MGGRRLVVAGLVERRAQRALAADIWRRPADATVELGDPVAHIGIPRIGVRRFVVEGVGARQLTHGPGHYPGTPMPEDGGNVAIAGHTSSGAPFQDLDALHAGDPVFVTTVAGRFRYDVDERLFVDHDAGWVLDPTTDDRLTLTTCDPRYRDEDRLVVVAKRVSAVG